MSKRRRKRRRPSRSLPSSPASSPSQAGDEAEEDDAAFVESTGSRVRPKRQRDDGAETGQGAAAAAARGTQVQSMIPAPLHRATGTEFGVQDPLATPWRQEPSGQGVMNMAHGLQRNGPPCRALDAFQLAPQDDADSVIWKARGVDHQQCTVPIAPSERCTPSASAASAVAHSLAEGDEVLVDAVAQRSLAPESPAQLLPEGLEGQAQEAQEVQEAQMVEVENFEETHQVAADLIPQVEAVLATLHNLIVVHGAADLVAALHVADSGYGTSSPGSNFGSDLDGA